MAEGVYRGPLEQVNECCWRIPKCYKQGMRVDGLIFADEGMIEEIKHDQACEQVANVAFLPGIQHASLAMPDIHWGYGFPIGGVCATDPAEGGVISPGGVGYDINCGVRLMRSDLFYQDVKPHLQRLMDHLFAKIPAGTGRGGKYRYNQKELRKLMTDGVGYLRDRDLATEGDVEHTEAGGCLQDAVPEYVSQRALERGSDQCGTLGSGNHFVEVQVVEAIFDEQAAQVMGLEKDMICVMVHSGSRGLGYQVCDDALKKLRGVPEKIRHPPARPPTGVCAGRQFRRRTVPGGHVRGSQLRLVQPPAADVASARVVRGGLRTQLARAADEPDLRRGPQHRQVRAPYDRRAGPQGVGPPQRRDAGLSCRPSGNALGLQADRPAGDHSGRHGTGQLGAGRANRQHGADVRHVLPRGGTQDEPHGGGQTRSGPADRPGVGRERHHRPARSWRGLAEEQPAAYKDVNMVVDVVHRANLASKVARMRPIGVVKG